MTGIPAEVITAAAKLLSAHYFDLKDGKPDAEEVWMAMQMLEAAAPVIAAQAAAAEWERLLAALREFLPKYVTTIVHGHALDGAPIYAAGLLAFPDVLVDIFALMDTPDCDLLDGAQDAPQRPGAPPECQAMPEGPESRTGDRRDATT